MRESSFWRSIRIGLLKASNNKILLQRIEDKLTLGIPDVHFCYEGKTGWIELKVLKDYPKKVNTPIKINHLTPHQKQWHKNYTKSLGKSFVLLKVNKDAFLFDGNNLGCLTDSTIMGLKYVLSKKYWENKINYDELLLLITQ